MDSSIISNEDIDGIILSIHVNNFFCHENLFIDFRIENNNVHSIMGENGSGKSTILTALVIGLGGRAASTFRGSNLQSFIKRGKTTATIKIKIKNSGPQAYKYELYGDSITIVRTINTSGGSYKILNASGTQISTKASDVKAITMAHDIQVENPISVLNQDDARSFHGVNAKEKYDAFRRATNFAQTEEYYNRAQENCKKANVTLARKNEAFLELSKEYKRLKFTYDQMKPQEVIENEKRKLQNELKWFDVAKLENEVENINREYEKIRPQCQKLAEKLQAIEENYANTSGNLESLRRRLSEPAARRGALERELHEKEAEARRVEERTRSARETRNRTHVRLEREKGQATDLLKAIRNIESGGDDGGARREALERKRAEAGAAAEEMAARRDTQQHEEEQARENAMRAVSEAEEATAAQKADEKELRSKKQELQELRQRSTESLAGFSMPMVQLCELVERAVRQGRFSKPPRGPIGKFLKVRNIEWASALEHIIGNTMEYFCVNTSEDSRRLLEIINQVKWKKSKPGVSCSEFRSHVHDVSARRVIAHGFTCALDELEIADPVVANYLIDMLDLETVLLVSNHDDAVHLSNSVDNVPINCSKVVTKDCTDYMPAPRYRIYGGVENPPRYFNTNANRIRHIEAKIAELEQSIALKTSEAAHLTRRAEIAQREQKRVANTLHMLQSTLRERQRAVREANEALEQHSAPHLTVLKEKYEDCKSNITKLEEDIRKLTDKEKLFEEEKKNTEMRVDEIKKEFEGVNREYKSLQEEKEQAQLKLEQNAAEKARYEQRVKEDTNRLQRVEVELEKGRNALLERKESLGSRPAHFRDRTEVQNQLTLLERQQSAASASTLKREDVRAQLDDVTDRRTRVKNELGAIKDLVDKITKLTNKHLELCYTVQTNIGRHVEFKFTNILKLRNYVGRIELDHAEGELELYINNRNTKSLSGGERSYSTVALFRAMWECVELPFYFMDEFDVFMDGENRTTVWQQLVQYAARCNGRQFVFLTQRELPLEQGTITVHRLPAPRN